MSMFSEMFMSADEVPDIKALNDRVEVMKEKVISKAKENQEELPSDIIFALKQKTVLYAGLPIYENRNRPFVLVVMALSAFLIVKGALHFGGFVLLLSAALMFFGYDAYSGIVHICMDHPGFISLPIIGQPCLEFQWHHYIPDDLVKKDFLQVCGDLNMVVAINVAIHLTYTSSFCDNKLILLLTGLKTLMAYFGQWSHRSSHQIMPSKRDPITKFLQRKGIMVSVGDHHKHHTPPHDTNFCLIGPCNTMIQKLVTTFPYPYFHLAILAFWTFADVYIIQQVVELFIK